jgi:hypothetical protein
MYGLAYTVGMLTSTKPQEVNSQDTRDIVKVQAPSHDMLIIIIPSTSFKKSSIFTPNRY